MLLKFWLFLAKQEFADHDFTDAPVPGGAVRPDVDEVQHEHVKNVFLIIKSCRQQVKTLYIL